MAPLEPFPRGPYLRGGRPLFSWGHTSQEVFNPFLGGDKLKQTRVLGGTNFYNRGGGKRGAIGGTLPHVLEGERVPNVCGPPPREGGRGNYITRVCVKNGAFCGGDNIFGGFFGVVTQ